MLLSITQQSLEKVLNGGKTSESFTNDTNNFLAMLLVLLIWLVLLLFVSKFLWNEVLVKLVTVVKPATSLVQLLGLFILLEIMLPK
jgi:hypothetical protein